jgi:hypothetical protein
MSAKIMCDPALNSESDKPAIIDILGQIRIRIGI